MPHTLPDTFLRPQPRARAAQTLRRLLAVLVGWTLLASSLPAPAEAASVAQLESRAKGLFGKTYRSKNAFEDDADDVLKDSRNALPDRSYDRKVDTRNLPDGEISKTDPGTGFKMTRKTKRTQEIWEKWTKGDTETRKFSGTFKVDRGAKRPSTDSLKDQIRGRHTGRNQSVSDFDFDWKDRQEKVEVDYILTTEKVVEETKYREPSRDSLKQQVRNAVSGANFDFKDFDFNDRQKKVTVTYNFERQVEVTKTRDVKECTPRYREECDRVKVGEDCRRVQDGQDCNQVKVGERCSGSGRNRRCEPVYERRCTPRYKNVCEPRYEKRCRQVRDGEDCKTVKKPYIDIETKTFKNQTMTFAYESYVDRRTVRDRDKKSATFAYVDDLDVVNGESKIVVADEKRYEKPVKEEPYGNWKVHYVVPPPSPFSEDSARSVNRTSDFSTETVQTRQTIALPYAVVSNNGGGNPGNNGGGNPGNNGGGNPGNNGGGNPGNSGGGNPGNSGGGNPGNSGGGNPGNSGGGNTGFNVQTASLPTVEFQSVPYSPGQAATKVTQLDVPTIGEIRFTAYVNEFGPWTTVAAASVGSRSASQTKTSAYSSNRSGGTSVQLTGSATRQTLAADRAKVSAPAARQPSGGNIGTVRKPEFADFVPPGQAQKAEFVPPGQARAQIVVPAGQAGKGNESRSEDDEDEKDDRDDRGKSGSSKENRKD